MSKRLFVVSLAAAAIISYGCGKTGSDSEAQVYGYVTVWESMGRGTLVSLVNGRAQTQLMLDENTKLVGASRQDGEAPMWYLDSAYQVDGRMNWAPAKHRDETGNTTLPRLSGIRDWIWATRIERLGETDAAALIESGVLVPKGSDVGHDWLVACFERAERNIDTEDELAAARRACLTRQGSSLGKEKQ